MTYKKVFGFFCERGIHRSQRVSKCVTKITSKSFPEAGRFLSVRVNTVEAQYFHKVAEAIIVGGAFRFEKLQSTRLSAVGLKKLD